MNVKKVFECKEFWVEEFFAYLFVFSFGGFFFVFFLVHNRTEKIRLVNINVPVRAGKVKESYNLLEEVRLVFILFRFLLH